MRAEPKRCTLAGPGHDGGRNLALKVPEGQGKSLGSLHLICASLFTSGACGWGRRGAAVPPVLTSGRWRKGAHAVTLGAEESSRALAPYGNERAR